MFSFTKVEKILQLIEKTEIGEDLVIYLCWGLLILFSFFLLIIGYLLCLKLHFLIIEKHLIKFTRVLNDKINLIKTNNHIYKYKCI